MYINPNEASAPQPKHAGPRGIPAPDGPANLIETDHVIGQDNFAASKFGISVDLHGKVFTISSLTVLFFVIITLALQDQVEPVFNTAFNFLTVNLSSFFLLAANIFLVLAFVLIFTPMARVRIGGANAQPEFSFIGWFSMLFAAGMGIGLMFYGLSEPLTHYGSAMGGITVENGVRTDWAPLGAAAGDPAAAASLSISTTIFHWGLHAWGTYAVVALALALFAYNKGLPLTMRSVFYPVLGERIWGWPGHAIDILAVFATLFGLATSLGLGATQAAAGLNYLFGIPNTNVTMVVLIISISLIALVSVVLGVDKGVQRLSQLNMVLAFLLVVFVMAVGPTLLIVTGFFENLVAYLVNLPALSMPFGREDANFSQGWTTFYWAWWVSWAPFVSMFIARVSRGRTVREFLIAVLLVPSTITVLWVSTLGGTAVDQVITDNFQGAMDSALELQMFVVFSRLPLSQITSLIGIVLVVVFFITSSDSGSLVIDSITAGGKVDAPKPQRIFWALIQGAIAIALLLGGGLKALAAAVIVTALPFTFVLLVACYGMVNGLISEPRGPKG
ncbi:BCCT family betaine/carnitine transporter [Halomonas ventosae]|uniref:BCCT family betaine/carnitine transporter n=1 Tax=Halomonas ventosae TaxID=229007 RepID=A0A4R6ZF01_9GAMM|nr:BCCT family betaine/carnitine transporter [Halomonas ventosae]